MQLILASTSPRRRELLQKAGILHTVYSIKVSEIPDKNLNADEQILSIAEQKAEAAWTSLKAELSQLPPFVLLSADTEVIWQGQLLGKPSTPAHALQTLVELLGQKHAVKTAVVFIDSRSGKKISHLETTWVTFKNVDRARLAEYVASGDPMDKAGSYGIQNVQSWLVESIEGDLDNVIGLPIKTVQRIIQKQGWELTK